MDAESDLKLQQEDKQEMVEERLKYLGFVQVVGVHLALWILNLYGYAKGNSGPLKPSVETVEGIIKNVVGPVYDKIHDIPFDLLKFLDRKIDEFVVGFDRRVPAMIKQASSKVLTTAQQAPATAQAVAFEVKRAGVVDTASSIAGSVYTKYEPTAKELFTKYEPKVEQCAALTWTKLNKLPLFSQVAQGAVSTGAFCIEKLLINFFNGEALMLGPVLMDDF